MFMQEMSRIINYYTEQEANRYLKKKTFDSSSRFQSKAIPIPRLVTVNTTGVGSLKQAAASAADDIPAVNFMGRVMNSLLFLTDPVRTVYAPECSAWFVHTASDQKQAPTQEVCGIRTFALLERSLGAIGLRGLDRLFAFRAVNELNVFLKFYTNEVQPFRTLLDQVDIIFLNRFNQ